MKRSEISSNISSARETALQAMLEAQRRMAEIMNRILYVAPDEENNWTARESAAQEAIVQEIAAREAAARRDQILNQARANVEPFRQSLLADRRQLLIFLQQPHLPHEILAETDRRLITSYRNQKQALLQQLSSDAGDIVTQVTYRMKIDLLDQQIEVSDGLGGQLAQVYDALLAPTFAQYNAILQQAKEAVIQVRNSKGAIIGAQAQNLLQQLTVSVSNNPVMREYLYHSMDEIQGSTVNRAVNTLRAIRQLLPPQQSGLMQQFGAFSASQTSGSDATQSHTPSGHP